MEIAMIIDHYLIDLFDNNIDIILTWGPQERHILSETVQLGSTLLLWYA